MIIIKVNMDTRVLCLLAIVNFYVPVHGAYKRWIGNTNFENGDNWNVGRKPCSKDTINFPDTIPPIFVQANLSVIEMVLPSNGEFVLGDMVSIGAPTSKTSEQNGSCTGEDVFYNRTEPLSWLDPLNWCEVTSPGGDCLAQQPTRLDTERIPCLTDDVIFPRGSTFYVSLDREVDIYVNTLNFQGKQYSTDTFNQFIRSPEGTRTFVRLDGYKKTTVNIKNSKCNDITGCACGNDVGQLRKKICDVESQTCGDSFCAEPVEAPGQCCGVCGAVISLDYGYGFKYSGLRERIMQDVVKDDSTNVEVVLSKTSSNKIQVVVIDSSGGSYAVRVGKKIAKYFDKDINDKRKFGLTHVEISVSGQSKTGPQEIKGHRGSMSTPSIVGIVVAIIIIIAVVALAMFCFIDKDRCRRNRLPSLANSFRRFSMGDTKNGDLELQIGDAVSFKDIMTRDPGDAGFDNPMYGTGIQTQNGNKPNEPNANTLEGPAVLDSSDVTFVRSDKGDFAFANPLYDQPKKEEQTTTETLVPGTLKLNPVYSEEGVEEDSQI